MGLAGVSRRLYDGGATYDFAQPVLHLNVVSSWGAWILALFQIPFIFNFFWSIWKGQKVGDNPGTRRRSSGRRPRRRRTATSPSRPQAYRGPYEYSVPGAAKDFSPQYEA